MLQAALQLITATFRTKGTMTPNSIYRINFRGRNDYPRLPRRLTAALPDHMLPNAGRRTRCRRVAQNFGRITDASRG